VELTEALARRRMVRSFSGRPVDPAMLDGLLERSTAAPTAGNTGGWDAVVLVGPEETSAFWAATTTEYWRARSRRWPGLRNASVVVALFADPGAYVTRYAEPDKAGDGEGPPSPALGERADAWPVPYWFVDAGFAAMALLLGAVDAGLGACFLGNFRGEAALCEALGVPPGRRYVGAVLIGEPGGEDPPSGSLSRERRPRRAMVHRGRW
jgi:nitroreductase